jgi:hypothetical protein
VPEKLRTQLCLAAEGNGADPTRVVVSSRHVHVDGLTGARSGPAPQHLIRPGQPPETYLFVKRQPSAGRTSMYTSTILCSRELAIANAWDESLRRHQDWDWLVRAGRLPGVRFVHAPQPLVLIQTGSVGSISAGTSWQDSLAWADRRLAVPEGKSRVYADFVAAQSWRYALGARSWSGVRHCIRRLIRNRRLPSWGPMVIAFGGLMPRAWIERMLTSSIRPF